MKTNTATVLNQLITLLLLLIVSFNSKAGEPKPLLDSLSLEQQKIYHRAAIDGQDQVPFTPPTSQRVNMYDNSINVPSEIERNIAEKLTTISLEDKVQKQLIQPSLEQFGYDLFSQVPTTFSPVTNIPVPLDYMVGPGDTIVAQLYGKTNVEYKLVVTRDGYILVPDMGPILVSGLTFSEVKENLKSRFEKQIFGTKAAITMGELRTINIMIVGDVIMVE